MLQMGMGLKRRVALWYLVNCNHDNINEKSLMGVCAMYSRPRTARWLRERPVILRLMYFNTQITTLSGNVCDRKWWQRLFRFLKRTSHHSGRGGVGEGEDPPNEH